MTNTKKPTITFFKITAGSLQVICVERTYLKYAQKCIFRKMVKYISSLKIGHKLYANKITLKIQIRHPSSPIVVIKEKLGLLPDSTN